MAQVRVIKKYPNRRLYDTEISSYITLEEIRQLVLDNEDFEVRDAKSGEDLSRSVLLQIISEHEDKGQPMLSPELQRVGFDAKPDEQPYVTDLRSSLISVLGVDGDPALLAKARSYVAALKSNPAAIPAAIRRPILITYAYNATPAEWETLLALTKAETNPVIKNFDVVMLGLAKDDALAKRALDLVKTTTFTDPLAMADANCIRRSADMSSTPRSKQNSRRSHARFGGAILSERRETSSFKYRRATHVWSLTAAMSPVIILRVK